MEMPEMKKGEMLAKLLIIGDTKVGKTSILTRLTQDTFSSSTIPTLGTRNHSNETKMEVN